MEKKIVFKVQKEKVLLIACHKSTVAKLLKLGGTFDQKERAIVFEKQIFNDKKASIKTNCVLKKMNKSKEKDWLLKYSAEQSLCCYHAHLLNESRKSLKEFHLFCINFYGRTKDFQHGRKRRWYRSLGITPKTAERYQRVGKNIPALVGDFYATSTKSQLIALAELPTDKINQIIESKKPLPSVRKTRELKNDQAEDFAHLTAKLFNNLRTRLKSTLNILTTKELSQKESNILAAETQRLIHLLKNHQLKR